MKAVKRIISEFFMSKGKFKPPYFWITIFLITILQMVYLKMYGPEKLAARISVQLILGCLGFVGVWLGVYTWFDKNRINPPTGTGNTLTELLTPAAQPPRQDGHNISAQ
jgi:hypothetical protein